MTATEDVLSLIGQLEAKLPAFKAEHKAPITKADDSRDLVRLEGKRAGVKDDRPAEAAPDEDAAFAELVGGVEDLREYVTSFISTAKAKEKVISGDEAFWRNGLGAKRGVRSHILIRVEKKPRQFKGEAARLADELDAYLDEANRMLENVRPVPDDWNPTDVYPAMYTVKRSGKTVYRPMGANPILRGVGAYGFNLFFGAVVTGDPRWFVRAFDQLKTVNDANTIRGGPNTTKSDGRLGIPYGMSSVAASITSALKHTALEAALEGLRGLPARLCWEAVGSGIIPDADLLREVNRWRALLRRHHMVRWGRFHKRITDDNPDGWPSEKDPSITGRNFGHSNLSEGDGSLELAVIETGMYRRGMRGPVTVELPHGVTETIELSKGTSERLETHPGFIHACNIFRQFDNRNRLHIFYRDDIRDPEMRKLYGKTGCMVWDQTTTGPRFTANAGYNALSFPSLYVLHEGGVLGAVLGSNEAAEAWLTALAGGVSVAMLPERLVAEGHSAYVMDDPLNERESRAFLLNGKPVRPFGGGASGTRTDDSPEWDAQLYGLPACNDPADLIDGKTARLRKHALEKWGKKPTDMAGGNICRLFNEIVRGRAY